MIATTIEAIAGAAYLDANDDGLAAVHTMMHNMGLFAHPLFLVKFRVHPIHAFTNK
jgi:hypothetical protein